MNGNGKYDHDRAIAEIDRILREMPGKSVDPPPHLRSKILANLPEEQGSRAWRRWGRWTAVLGAAAACLLAAVLLYRGVSPPSPPSHAITAQNADPLAVSPPSPTITAKKTSPNAPPRGVREVKIHFYHPTASKVAVTGDFNGWNPEGVLLASSAERGVWETTLRLKPGAYAYNIIVDGNLLVPDPNAPEQMPDGFGGTNSILLVKGGKPT